MAEHELVTVATFDFATEAWIYRNRLVDAGIDAFIENEHYVNAVWIEATAVGGVQVRVPRNQVHRIPGEPADLPKFESESEQTVAGEPTCSHCGSNNVHVSRYAKRWIYLLWALIGFPLPICRRSIECYECGYRDGTPSLPKVQPATSLQMAGLIIAIVLTALVALIVL